MAEQFNLDLSGNKPKVTPRKDKTVQRTNMQMVTFLFSTAGSIGFAIIVPLLLGIGIGIWLDSKYMTKPQFTLGGLVVGLFLSVANFIVTLKKIVAESKQEFIR